MEGTPEEKVVNYRTLEELFDERKGVMKYDLNVSMLEVYNEKIRDCLVENSAQPATKMIVLIINICILCLRKKLEAHSYTA